jgi:hypothetical protein
VGNSVAPGVGRALNVIAFDALDVMRDIALDPFGMPDRPLGASFTDAQLEGARLINQFFRRGPGGYMVHSPARGAAEESRYA